MFWGTFLPGERSEMIALRNREAFEQLLYDLRSLDRLFQPGAVPVQCCACLAGRRSYAHATRGLSPNESSLGSGKTQVRSHALVWRANSLCMMPVKLCVCRKTLRSAEDCADAPGSAASLT